MANVHLLPDGRVLIKEGSIVTSQGGKIGVTVQELAENLVIAELLDLECAAIKLPRAANNRHTVFSSSLRRARAPLHNLVTQARHGTAEYQSPVEYAHIVKQAIFKFKRTIDALQRATPRGHIPGLHDLILSAHSIVRRMRNPFHNKKTWIAERAKWWAAC